MITTQITCRRKCLPFRLSVIGYGKGAKRCQKCGIMMKYEGLYCPCCGQKLRTKARNPTTPRKVKRY